MSALEAAEEMIAAMGGPKPPPPPQQSLDGTWDKVRRSPALRSQEPHEAPDSRAAVAVCTGHAAVGGSRDERR